MATNEKPSEQLLSTVLQKFPLVSKWHNIRSHHKSLKSFDFRLFYTVGLMFGGVSGWCIYLTAINPTSFGVWMAVGFGVLGVASLYAACKGLWYNFSPSKQKKYVRSNKPAVRDCIAQKKAVRIVATLVPEFSTADLKLLQSHPQFNPIFNNVFEDELKKRTEAQIVNSVNVRFTENYVNAHIEEPQDVFCTLKNNLLSPSTK